MKQRIKDWHEKMLNGTFKPKDFPYYKEEVVEINDASILVDEYCFLERALEAMRQELLNNPEHHTFLIVSERTANGRFRKLSDVMQFVYRFEEIEQKVESIRVSILEKLFSLLTPCDKHIVYSTLADIAKKRKPVYDPSFDNVTFDDVREIVSSYAQYKTPYRDFWIADTCLRYPEHYLEH